MAGSKNIDSKKNAELSVKSDVENAPKVQSGTENSQSVGTKSLFAAGSTPNPSEPMDRSVLETIGIVGNGNTIASSPITSIASLADANKGVAKASVLPKAADTRAAEPKGGIKVDPGYKPSFESAEKAKLTASMEAPKPALVEAGSGSSLQSRLEKEQSNLYRATTGNSNNALKTGQQLGGGFRVASDPNAKPAPQSSYAAPRPQPGLSSAAPAKSSPAPSPAQTVYHEEAVQSKSGVSVGAIGLLGGLLLAGGVGAVYMNPGILSTTGASDKSASTQVVSAPETLIPQVIATQPAPLQASVEAPSRERMAAVQVMPAPEPSLASVAGAGSIVQRVSSEVTSTSASNASATGKDIPLNLDASVLKVEADQYVRIGGMPDDATLSSGVDMGDGNWLVAPDAVKGLKLTASEGFKGTLELYMQKIKDDARTAVGTPKTFKVTIGEQPKPPVVAVAPRIIAPSEPKVAAYNPVPVQPTPPVKPVVAPPVFRTVPKLPKLPTGISEDDEDDGIGALPTVKANKYERPHTNLAAGVAPAIAPRRLNDAIPIGRTFSKDNYGETAVPIRQQKTASIAAVAPIPQISDQRAKLLLKRGNNLYRLGDLISARSLYGQVAATGNADAALAMGRTYDPIYFEKLGVQGFQPEPNRALEWYEKAKSAGLAKAQGKIDNLNYYLKQ